MTFCHNWQVLQVETPSPDGGLRRCAVESWEQLGRVLHDAHLLATEPESSLSEHLEQAVRSVVTAVLREYRLI